MSTINNIALERFEVLPKAIQEAIAHSNWSEKVRIICKANRLSFDMGTVVENSTLMVMVGVLQAEELLEELKEEGVSEETAQNVIREIDAQIFLPIKKELVETFNNFEGADFANSDEDKSLDILAGNPQTGEVVTEDEEREQVLKEIEDMDSAIDQTKDVSTEKLEIPGQTEQKIEAVKTAEQTNQTGTPQETPTEAVVAETTSIEQKLTQTVSAQPQTVKIDPYREIIE